DETELEVAPEPLFAGAQGCPGPLALDQLDGLARVEIHEPQLVVRRPVRLAKMGGNHAHQVPAAAEERRRLYRAIPGGSDDFQVRLEGGLGQHVLDDDALPALESQAAGSRAFVHGVEVFE